MLLLMIGLTVHVSLTSGDSVIGRVRFSWRLLRPVLVDAEVHALDGQAGKISGRLVVPALSILAVEVMGRAAEPENVQ